MSNLSSELRIYKNKSEVTDGIVYKTDVRVTLYLANDNIPDREIAILIKGHMKDFINNVAITAIETML